jgi:ubiquinone/menaquinone biosynthesis C-methylase UbiE
MTTNAPEPAPLADKWSDWLLRGRHGGDQNLELAIRDIVHRIRDRVLDGAKPFAGMTLVDVGSGDGLIPFGAFDRIGPSIRAILTDISAPLLKRVEECAVQRGLRDRCSFLQTSAERLDGVPDSSADVVTARAVLVYVTDKLAAVRQIHRVLKPGGRVSIGEPIYHHEALQLAAVTDFLRSQPDNAATNQARIVQRCLAAQLPSTLPEIRAHPLTNFSERELIHMFELAGFPEVHLELHIDVRKPAPVPWDTFIDIAPRPGAPTLREVMASHLNAGEQRQLEAALRPAAEAGRNTVRDVIAYLTAVKPVV